MEQTKKRSKFISVPLFKQTIKSSWLLWLVMTLGSALIFFVINVVVGSKNIFTNIDMTTVSQYVTDQKMSWIQILGLLEQMGFSLNRISTMASIDLNSILNELVYKIAGVLLPMVFVMITANSLIASQVTNGSMAYVLSTPTSRKTVIRTQFLFMLAALVAMYVVITGTALISESIAGAIRMKNNPGATNMLPLRTLLYCFASFSAMFALTGICFGASAFFNKSQYSIAVGGGVCILSFLGCILGLFGNKVFVSVGIGVASMRVFDFISLYTLIDTESINNFSKALAGQDAVISYNWIWEIGILFVIGIVFAYVGGRRFTKKDLPL
ncbi:MAG: ABC transporter permease [Bacilli bacterium]|nr:ABC transporter permease [Bacilli bacterium]